MNFDNNTKTGTVYKYLRTPENPNYIYFSQVTREFKDGSIEEKVFAPQPSSSRFFRSTDQRAFGEGIIELRPEECLLYAR